MKANYSKLQFPFLLTKFLLTFTVYIHFEFGGPSSLILFSEGVGRGRIHVYTIFDMLLHWWTYVYNILKDAFFTWGTGNQMFVFTVILTVLPLRMGFGLYYTCSLVSVDNHRVMAEKAGNKYKDLVIVRTIYKTSSYFKTNNVVSLWLPQSLE